MSRKIGIWGGTFDPPHIGHLAMMRGTADVLGLDLVLAMPAHIPPHKTATSAAHHRKAMVERLCSEDIRLKCDDRELTSTDMSYTVRSCKQLRAAYGGDRLIFCMGADSFMQFHRWHEWREILDNVDIAVASRPGYISGNEAVAAYCLAKFPSEQKIIHMDLAEVPISSSEIRQLPYGSVERAEWLTQPILNYIEENKLYL